MSSGYNWQYFHLSCGHVGSSHQEFWTYSFQPSPQIWKNPIQDDPQHKVYRFISKDGRVLPTRSPKKSETWNPTALRHNQEKRELKTINKTKNVKHPLSNNGFSVIFRVAIRGCHKNTGFQRSLKGFDNINLRPDTKNTWTIWSRGSLSKWNCEKILNSRVDGRNVKQFLFKDFLLI